MKTIICTCHEVPQDDIEKAMARGCQTVRKISTATTAGVGQCGGSCRPTIEKMLTHYLATGAFLSNPTVSTRKVSKK